MKTKVSIHHYGTSLTRGIRLIEKFKERNNVHFDLTIKLDLAEKDLGYFFYKKKENSLYINPIRCNNNVKNEMLGHPEDDSIYATISHEFSHFLDVYFKLLYKYSQEKFTLKSLILTHSGTILIEELADIISIYLINPYCLKIIDKERFDWLKTFFKSPNNCGEKTFLKFFNNWPENTRNEFKKKYKYN